jgi:ElaB/YqjD/DUF883 family membrane-anchored ribosome-binding protein
MKEISMADPKNENAKSASSAKPSGSENAGKVSAGTSVGNIGEPPMPHAHDATKSASSKNQNQSQQGTSKQGESEQGAAAKAQQAADQVRQRAGEAYEGASEWAQDTYERVSDWASDAYDGQRDRVNQARRRSAQSFGHARGGVQSYVAENPMVVGLVGLAAGLLLGALLPRTRRENEVFGEWSDEVRNQGLRYAREAANRGREYVEETFSGEDPEFSRHESEFRAGRDEATSRH